ncbi:MAG TPA: hypothetical protein VGF33_03655 [Caulobacteraceae bacterium]|jgi:hypothetical protein
MGVNRATPLALTAISILALAGPSLAKSALAKTSLAKTSPAKARHHPHSPAGHLVLEMKDDERVTPGPAHAVFARTDGDQPLALRHSLGGKGAIATLGYNRGETVRHPDELNGPGAARFNHADSAVGAGVKVPL